MVLFFSKYTCQLLLSELHLGLANTFSEILDVKEDSLLKPFKSKPQPPKETGRFENKLTLTVYCGVFAPSLFQKA